ncbi:MAG: methanogenesis marker 9 domain-containing protein [Methanomicrobiales archaeon]|nr:methanogenesis marker 9 domain-containing protein [Methanomicrobiales archaeon]MDI6877294.1 methanogenesis marker 9 domain-containing protein [Methanomicrobiales archaeon]
MSEDLFELSLNNTRIKTPIALASMAGITDAPYVSGRADHIGAAFIGGYSIDAKTIAASREMACTGRKEWLYDDPVEELSRQIALLDGSGLAIGINLRGSAPESYRHVAEALGDSVIYEIDAHCRQAPMVAAGAGEHLIRHPEDLAAAIAALKSAGVTVSVKIRAGVAADDRHLARAIWRAGADILHADLMDFGYRKCREIRNSMPLFLIANNGLHTFGRMREMFSHGADMISVARHSEPGTLAGLDAAITRYTEEYGWYNAPKQICRGGDIRGLAFCCLPVKDCALLPTLARIGLSREEYVQCKRAGVRGTLLEPGPLTCFGSMAWCCKATSACMLRDTSLARAGISTQQYMKEKHHLADKIMKKIFHDSVHPDDAR